MFSGCFRFCNKSGRQGLRRFFTNVLLLQEEPSFGVAPYSGPALMPVDFGGTAVTGMYVSLVADLRERFWP